jgi:hypothetical protein
VRLSALFGIASACCRSRAPARRTRRGHVARAGNRFQFCKATSATVTRRSRRRPKIVTRALAPGRRRVGIQPNYKNASCGPKVSRHV